MAEENDSQQEASESEQTQDSAEEPSMDEILGSIREILSDDGERADGQENSDTEEETSPVTAQENQSEPQSNEVEAEQTDTTSATGLEPAPETEPTPEPEGEPESEPEAEPEAEPESEPEAEPEPETVAGPEPETEAKPETEPGQNDMAEMTQEPKSESDDFSTVPPLEDDVGEFLELTQQMIAPSPSDVDAGAPILSGSAQMASTDPLQELAKALLNRRDIAIGNRDLTLEGLIREILRPLLREWLDENLPYLIERLVKKEIDHMVNRAERLDL